MIVETSEDYHRLIHVAQTLSQIDLTATFHLSTEAHREQLSGLLIPWLADICSSSILGDDLVLRRTVGEVLSKRSKAGTAAGQPPETRSKLSATRLERLFLVFSRFWKAPRIAWMKVFVRILTADMHFKVALGQSCYQKWAWICADCLGYACRQYVCKDVYLPGRSVPFLRSGNRSFTPFMGNATLPCPRDRRSSGPRNGHAPHLTPSPHLLLYRTSRIATPPHPTNSRPSYQCGRRVFPHKEVADDVWAFEGHSSIKRGTEVSIGTTRGIQ